MRIVDKDLLREFASAWQCEFCGKRTPNGCDPAHIFSRGAGRVDVRENLVSLCAICHRKSHAGHRPNRADLLSIAAKRENTTVEAIEALVYGTRRKPK